MTPHKTSSGTTRTHAGRAEREVSAPVEDRTARILTIDEEAHGFHTQSTRTPPAQDLRLLPADSEARKTFPIASGVLDYFPDAVAAVAEISFLGNQKHNPGEPLHWARGKSMDHADCILRHLIERGSFDGKVRHSAALAWRALANLQEELEQEYHLSTPRGATDLPPR